MHDEVHVDVPDEESADDLAVRIVELFERLEGAHATELPELYSAVEVDALATQIEHANGADNLFVRFEYGDSIVRVYGDERIEVAHEPGA